MRPVVLCFSGKRKSGKDFLCAFLARQLRESDGLKVCIRGVSHPLKEQYAIEHGLDVEQLKSNGPYKEIYREAMVKWGEEMRAKDPTYFCRKTITSSNLYDVYIIPDCRRPSDISYFKENFTETVRFIRVESDLNARLSRGYVFTSNIDNAETECALDSFKQWDFVVENNAPITSCSTPPCIKQWILKITEEITEILGK